MEKLQFSLLPLDRERLLHVCGQCDEHLKWLEQKFTVRIHRRETQFEVYGQAQEITLVKNLLSSLYTAELSLTPLTLGDLEMETHFMMQASMETVEKSAAVTCLRLPNGRSIQAKNQHQAEYINNLSQYAINFGIGPAGTGKTYLAVVCALQALLSHKIKRVILVRPVVETGERLGFLPGDVAQKIDPYLRPLFDALYDILGPETVQKYLEKNIIELAPLAYMRGRTLSDAFIILDEAQNTTQEQMKMFLTRFGFGATLVINGDITQIDLPKGVPSGLNQALQYLTHIKGISFTHFSEKDIVRHPLVQEIVNAYKAT